MIDYPYDRGDLLESPNTYFYTQYGGMPFLEAWRLARSGAAQAISAPMERPSPLPDGAPAGSVHAALEQAHAAALQLTPGQIAPSAPLEGMLKRFEISKRVYDFYDSACRPVDRTAYRTLAHYLRLAEVFEIAYDRSRDLRFLNALLKIVDTLSSRRNALPPEEAPRLARLIDGERRRVSALANALGLTLP